MNQKIEIALTSDVEIYLKRHKIPYYLDKEVFTFAIAMQNTLDSHRPNKGDSWRDMSQQQIIARLTEETVEVISAACFLSTDEGRKNLANEYTDVALFCMFGATLTEDKLPL